MRTPSINDGPAASIAFWSNADTSGVSRVRRCCDGSAQPSCSVIHVTGDPSAFAWGIALAQDGHLDPRIIGDASRAGSYGDQDLKRVWHCVARFGHPGKPQALPADLRSCAQF